MDGGLYGAYRWWFKLTLVGGQVLGLVKTHYIVQYSTSLRDIFQIYYKYLFSIALIGSTTLHKASGVLYITSPTVNFVHETRKIMRHLTLLVIL